MKLLNVLFLFLFLSGCASEESGPSDSTSATNALCKYWWRANDVDYDGSEMSILFNFNFDGTGTEIIDRLPAIGTPPPREEHYFKWEWTSDRHRSICIMYGENDLSYIDELFINDRILTGLLNGQEIKLDGSDKYY